MSRRKDPNYMKELAARHKAEHKCVRCSAPTQNGRRCCPRCIGIAAKREAARTKERLDAGMCMDCGIAPVVPGHVRCQVHAEQKRQYGRDYKRNKTQRGLCGICSEPVVPGKKYCERHVIYFRKLSREKMAYRKKNGLCHHCDRPALPGKTRCERHLITDRTQAREAFQEKMYSGNGKKAKERDNHACRICGDKTHRLEIHHIDGNGSLKHIGEQNNDLDNLISLCRPCHRSLTRFCQPGRDIELAFMLIRRGRLAHQIS